MPMLATSYPTIVIIGVNLNGLVIATLLHAAEITNVQLFDSAPAPAPAPDTEAQELPPATESTANALLEELIVSAPYHNDPFRSANAVHEPKHSIRRAELQTHLLRAMIAGLGDGSLHWKHRLTAVEPAVEGTTVTARFAPAEEGSQAGLADMERIVADAIIVTDDKALSSIGDFNAKNHKRLVIVPDNSNDDIVTSSSLVNARDLVDSITDNASGTDSYQQHYDIPKAFDDYKTR